MSVILILIYTGLRIGKLLDLKKEDIHLEERWFHVRESKTKSGIRDVPIAEKIVPFFERWLAKGCDYFIFTPENKHFIYRNYYDSVLCKTPKSLLLLCYYLVTIRTILPPFWVLFAPAQNKEKTPKVLGFSGFCTLCKNMHLLSL